MTDIEELSSNNLRITFKIDRATQITYLFMGLAVLAPAIYLVIWGWHDIPTGQYPELATPFKILLMLVLTAGAFYLLSKMFDATKYEFDKTTDLFRINGRKYFFQKWHAEGTVSGIALVRCEIKENSDGGDFSEIFIEHRTLLKTRETIKCGTHNAGDDDNIADAINQFLKQVDKDPS